MEEELSFIELFLSHSKQFNLGKDFKFINYIRVLSLVKSLQLLQYIILSFDYRCRFYFRFVFFLIVIVMK